MAGHRMAAVDAQFYWMSAKVPSDQFLLYAFDGEPDDLDSALDRVRGRARACADLSMRVADDCAARYPRWVPTPAEPDQIVRQELTDDGWDGCLAAVAGLAARQLDIRQMAWRLHVFTPVHAIPGVSRPGTVAVLQVAHALGDGARASAMAAWLFGRPAPVPTVAATRAGFPPRLAVAAARAHRRLVRDTEAGLVPHGVGLRPLVATNARPGADRAVRTLVRRRGQIPGPTVTVGVLARVAEALAEWLGGEVDSLGAEVPMVKPGPPLAYNHFGNAVVGLYPGLPRAERMNRIAGDLADARRRFEHPATRASDRAFAAVPAALLRWGVSHFDPDIRPAQVAGNTVVSSVYRGVDDLRFGGAPVTLTAGYPALSSVMGLTHGVHGIGDTVAISVHAARSAVPDIDGYLRVLDAAL
ncbi:DUF1298 domain-containing protein [Mycobacterium asiaticum]|uniref:WS/DGAT domain-containing protein n=1 Tax=Mycobacterium asiaticum TaxID=1790 RepID=UPI0007EF24D7|nr:WS/DGAT domain-containing protein [Mycobacterium asiaticum]OBK92922.1 DUF1298 domain-containing protein [Mycobacterium asiaticum]